MADSSLPSMRSCPGCAFLSQQPGERDSRTSPLRITQLLGCNEPPLDAELSEFQLFRAQSPAIMADLDAKITQAHDMLQRFIRAREHAEARLHDSDVLAHPIRRVPTEILTHIFLHCFPVWIDGLCTVPDYDSMDPGHPPWTLSQVCRRWRRLSLSLPELWSNFNLVLRLHKHRITPQECVYKTSLHMERAANYPLSLYLSSASRTNCLAMHPVLPVLQASSSRWRHLRFSFYMADLTSLDGHPFPLLEAITAQRLHDPGIVKAFRSAPNLRFFFSQPGTNALKIVTVPYPELLCAQFCDDLSSRSVACMRKMTGLHELTMRLEPSQLSEVEGNDIVLLRLLCLRVTESEGVKHGLLASFLERLKTPSLSELHLAYRTSIMLFPTASPPMTIRGEIGLHRNNTRNLLLFLSRVPTITSLAIGCKSLTSEFVIGLTIVPKRAFLLPRLQSLDISWCDYPAKMVPPKFFWAMFESRQGTPTPGAILEKIDVPQWLDNVGDERWRAIKRRANVTVRVV